VSTHTTNFETPDTGRDDRGTQAYTQLRELIVRGRLAPGTWIIETDIADRLGVSRTPVRAALQRLQQEGYIVASARGQQYRAAVAALTKEDARELFGIMGQLEALAARNAAELPQDTRADLVSRLRDLNAQLLEKSNATRPDSNEMFDLDTRFHRCFVEAGAGPRLLGLHEAINPQAERYLRLYLSATTDQISTTSAAEHDAIMDAIEMAQLNDVQLAVQANWRNGAERLSKVIESVGERGSW
jgi:DNA-binding GntR family transcriptional regulator